MSEHFVSQQFRTSPPPGAKAPDFPRSPGGTDEPIAFRLTNFTLFRLAAIIFLAPNLILAARLAPLGGGLVAMGSIAAAYVFLAAPKARGHFLAAPVDLRAFGLCALLAMAALLLSGEMHVFYAARDWLTRDTILADLTRQGFPVAYADSGETWLLRAPLGFYLGPASIGRSAGLFAAHVALFTQNAALLTIILYLFSRLARTSSLPFALLFLGYAGADIIPVLAQAMSDWPYGQIKEMNLMVWSRGHGDPNFTFWGHAPQLFWAPNHTLPGWWFAVLLLLKAEEEIDLPVLLASFLVLLFWSPLAMLGAAPLLLWSLRDFRPGKLDRRFVAAGLTGAGFLPILAYLSMDAGAVPHEWLFGKEHFWPDYLWLIAIGLPQALVVALAWRSVDPAWRGPLVAALGTLLLLPFYSLGRYNDFVVRAPLAPMAILAVAFCKIVLRPPSRAVERVALVVIALTAPTALSQLSHAFLYPAYRISDCNLVTASLIQVEHELPRHYLARVSAAPQWLLAGWPEPLRNEERDCWPDHPAHGQMSQK